MVYLGFRSSNRDSDRKYDDRDEKRGGFRRYDDKDERNGGGAITRGSNNVERDDKDSETSSCKCICFTRKLNTKNNY